MKYLIIPILILSSIIYLYKNFATKRTNKFSAEEDETGVSAEKVSFGAIVQKIWNYVFDKVTLLVCIGAIVVLILLLLKYFMK